ncbi:MAG: hypothetical protein CMK83_23720 [Pseudomonadales bacterium]|jgi:hypothetical protein|uniref:DUF3135 domain-containing protein n=1 Tax=unclassified Ketobacter TaxID=2639109 RepID=UPI000C59A66B|nr:MULTISPECIES: DUF3135 domain-containing protein [unclassified Ketobacter]MAA59563.1 hypothetical protein [Pseudomonadales bacterium]MEC8813580.1 DUF3135 domain-containing protein [Pseudomonadota bacterium]TNC88469.1 MAG: hypothetical protein CSH49_11465 [Alcanivorax sp.]HAG96573.1 DUF3135 domain-containing protein [Gammaproteobacteria bacterium]MAQ27231.1 hypothetical protein [Pseudomonadales bacterium]|tara:strand:+ start:1343 stop:1687 length:345 start_codon:yes stop_codon:yes gene_type:complete
MSYDLPEFDKLREMAQRDPEQLERLRIELCDRLIQEAPEKYRRKLRGLQFRVDMERRRAKSPMAACIAISGMMHDSFDRLRNTLNEAAGNVTPGYMESTADDGEAAKVLPFRRA